MPEFNLAGYRIQLGKQIVQDGTKTKEAPRNDPTDPTAVALDFMLRSAKTADTEYIQVEAYGYKQQIEYLLDREALIDLYTIAFAVTEVRTVITRLRDEVFRRGGETEPAFDKKCPVCGREYQENEDYCTIEDEEHSNAVAAVEKRVLNGTGENDEELNSEIDEVFPEGRVPLIEPDPDEFDKMEAFFESVNAFSQTFIDVLSELEDDLNIVDDAFLHLIFEYLEGNAEDPETNQVRKIHTHGKLLQLLRVDPTSIEFDLSTRGVPGESNWFCLEHRDQSSTEKGGSCPECEAKMTPAFFKMKIDTSTTAQPATGKAKATATHFEFLASWEVIHQSKFTPSRTYGYPPMLTVMDKALTLWGMDRLMYAQMYERKLPRGIIVTVTSDTDGFLRQKREIEQRIAVDPNYIPWIAIRPAQRATAKTEWVALQPSPKEMQYTEVRQEVASRAASMWGMPPLFQGNLEGVGGMNTETQQIVIAGRIIEADQHRFNHKIIAKVLRALGIEGWTFTLMPPEELQVDRDLDVLQKRTEVAERMWKLGFNLDWQPQTKTFKYQVPEEGLEPRIAGAGEEAEAEELGVPALGELFGKDGDEGEDESQEIGIARIARPGGRVRTK